MTPGNSIPNGAGTRTNANHRWPDVPATRLRAAGLRRGVADMGVAEAYARYSGQSALRRYNRDKRSSAPVRLRLFR